MGRFRVCLATVVYKRANELFRTQIASSDQGLGKLAISGFSDDEFDSEHELHHLKPGMEQVRSEFSEQIYQAFPFQLKLTFLDAPLLK